ncbi:MAG TPA: alpha/beta hydrolase [Candidatus Limnocylindria bacterium]|nr:alpha/beta hydrolase [Candidatus Limnocylindria bacterium]
MSFELPDEAGAARRAAIGRWVSFALVVILIILLGYLGYVGFTGSAQLADAAEASTDCRTPAAANGWTYEAINYDASTDAALADFPDPADCPNQGEPASTLAVTSDGVHIAGWYIPAGNGMGPEGATVILAHPYEGNKSTMLAHATLLHEDYNLVLLDFRNHGQSSGDQTTQGALEQNDVRAMVDWLEREKDPEQIALLGVAMGGAAALGEAVGDDRIGAIILDSTHATIANAIQARLEADGYPLALPGSWSVLLGSLLRTGQDISAADPVQRLAHYGSRPVLIIEGGQDELIGSTDADELLAAAQDGGADAQLEICLPAGHGTSLEACAGEYRDWVLGFLSRSLAS